MLAVADSWAVGRRYFWRSFQETNFWETKKIDWNEAVSKANSEERSDSNQSDWEGKPVFWKMEGVNEDVLLLTK